MKYYVVSDIHSYYDCLIDALTIAGFFNDKTPHQLIICGDLFDRGNQVIQLQEFILSLMNKNEVILIKGNHEELLMDIVHGFQRYEWNRSHHISNGTTDTVLQICNCQFYDLYDNTKEMYQKLVNSPIITKIIPNMKNYYETQSHIFVHGWIPCYLDYLNHYSYYDNWRNASDQLWQRARWTNGMKAWHDGVKENGKTIVCGHFHCSFGHTHYESDGSEFDEDDNHNPFIQEGIIALDSTCAYTNKLNCIVIEDNPLN